MSSRQTTDNNAVCLFLNHYRSCLNNTSLPLLPVCNDSPSVLLLLFEIMSGVWSSGFHWTIAFRSLLSVWGCCCVSITKIVHVCVRLCLCLFPFYHPLMWENICLFFALCYWNDVLNQWGHSFVTSDFCINITHWYSDLWGISFWLSYPFTVFTSGYPENVI